MKKAIKSIMLFCLFAVIIPALAGVAIMTLWNALVPAVCGFAAITFWQGVGFFLLGQILTGGFVLGFFLLGMGVHAVAHRHHKEWYSQLHDMSAEERREFILRRRAEHAGFHNRTHNNGNVAE